MKNAIQILTLVTMVLFAGTLFTACTGGSENTSDTVAEEEYDMATAKSEIVAANRNFATYFNAGDSAAVANLYTEDAKFMMNGAPAIVGRDNIQSVLSGIMQSGITRVDLTTVDVWGTEDLVTEEGQLSLYAGDTKADQGKYMVLWKRVDGEWKLFRDIFNSDMPAQ